MWGDVEGEEGAAALALAQNAEPAKRTPEKRPPILPRIPPLVESPGVGLKCAKGRRGNGRAKGQSGHGSGETPDRIYRHRPW